MILSGHGCICDTLASTMDVWSTTGKYVDLLRGLIQGQNEAYSPAGCLSLACITYHTGQARPGTAPSPRHTSCMCTSWAHMLGPFSCIHRCCSSQSENMFVEEGSG